MADKSPELSWNEVSLIYDLEELSAGLHDRAVDGDGHMMT